MPIALVLCSFINLSSISRIRRIVFKHESVYFVVTMQRVNSLVGQKGDFFPHLGDSLLLRTFSPQRIFENKDLLNSHPCFSFLYDSFICRQSAVGGGGQGDHPPQEVTLTTVLLYLSINQRTICPTLDFRSHLAHLLCLFSCHLYYRTH